LTVFSCSKMASVWGTLFQWFGKGLETREILT
jgi:hypothetical protein